ncbi:MAG: AIR synthase-related protein, partial [Candidatus Omnitrophica bacterium]|nr:AIR synthase-related protein [Candidatus Omnitrophota bacterium]
RDTALRLGVPFISGKDSLNNEYNFKGRSISIPGTLLISAISVIDNYKRAVTSYFKREESLIYIIGKTFQELGGSIYYELKGFLGNEVPKHNPKMAKRIFSALNRITNLGLALSIHDCSEGGLAVALAEMTFGGDLGVEVFLREVPLSLEEARDDFILFSESNSRFVVEVERKNQKRFEKILKTEKVPFGLIGCVRKEPIFKVYGLEGKVCLDTEIKILREAWQKTLRW